MRLRLLVGVAADLGYGILELPRQPPTHLLLELDRGTEPHARLLDKARGYAKALPMSSLRDAGPLIVVAVPSVARARRAARAFGSIGVSMLVVTWTPEHAGSTLVQIQWSRP